MTLDELRDIFYSGYSPATSWDTLDTLFIAIDRDAVRYRSKRLVTKNSYQALCAAIVGTEGLGPQEKAHMALKHIAKDYLTKTMRVDAVNESYFAGLHPDTQSVDCRYIIECGTTDPSCVAMYLNDPRVAWVGNIPYPFAEESHLALHVFERGGHYYAWQQEVVSRNRRVFERYHRR